MKYDLNLFDKLISNNRVEVSEEVNIIIEEIKQTAFSLRTEQEIKLYIQNHQLALIQHKNYDSICVNSDAVLYFIETQFFNFVNDKLKVSDLGKLSCLNKYKGVIEEYQCVFKSCLNEKLCNHLKPLTEPEKCNNCTIHYMHYVSKFWKNWLSYYPSFQNILEDEVMTSFLISQNFNPPTFFKYIISEIIGELHQVDDPHVQEQVLLSYAKRFSIIPVRIGATFHPDYPNIKQILVEWINIEIKQCRKKQKKHNPEQQVILSKSAHKIETSMSVAQTAYLFKLFNKAGIVTNKTQMDVLHVLSDKFCSKKTDQISFDSLHNKYYNVEDRTKESVKELLTNLLKQID